MVMTNETVTFNAAGVMVMTNENNYVQRCRSDGNDQ